MAIDFETANEQRASVCAVGITEVRDAQIIRTSHWLIQPPTGDYFTNTWVHGIRPQDIVGAPTWAQSLATIEQAAGPLPLVAHNSPFDKSVFTSSSEMIGARPVAHDWFDTVRLSRACLDLPRHWLNNVADYLGFGDFNHHHAGADAEVCAKIAIALSTGVKARHAEIEYTVPGVWNAVAPMHTPRKRQEYVRLPQQNAEADQQHPLYGTSLTFSGDLKTLSRTEARARAAALGAVVTSGPTKKTRLVIVGDFDPRTLKPGAKVSSKIQKVLDLQAKGQNIEMIGEADFLELLNLKIMG